MFRLGELMSVRLPSSQAYVEEVEKEHRWLPILAPQLPLPIPEPLAMGKPGCGSRGRGRCTGGSMARQQRPRRWRTCLSSPPTWPTFSPPFTRWTRPAVRQTYYHHGTLENYLDAFQAGGLHLTELTDVLARADAHRQTRIPRPGAFPPLHNLGIHQPLKQVRAVARAGRLCVCLTRVRREEARVKAKYRTVRAD